jgi:RHS repeat-associated protein
VSSYSYNASNELTSSSSGSYTYDDNGNTLTDAGGKSYTWDFENRLISATVPGKGTVTFKYDPFSRRIYKSSPTFTGIFAYDGASLIETVSSTGAVVARYTQGPRIDEPLAELRSSGTSYYEADGITSITSLSNSTGVLANTYTFDSFGKLTAFTGTLTNPFQYTAREFDPETGIYAYRARYYDQSVGRFLSEDPRQFAVGVNLYDYVRNNPANFRDPLGAFPAWGWWCGPNWTGGMSEPCNPAHASIYHPPWGATDTACMNHDICYYECRRDHPCSKGERAKCMRNCDANLLTQAPYSPIGNLVSTAVYARWLPNSSAFGGTVNVTPYPVRLGTTIEVIDSFGPVGWARWPRILVCCVPVVLSGTTKVPASRLGGNMACRPPPWSAFAPRFIFPAR